MNNTLNNVVNHGNVIEKMLKKVDLTFVTFCTRSNALYMLEKNPKARVFVAMHIPFGETRIYNTYLNEKRGLCVSRQTFNNGDDVKHESQEDEWSYNGNDNYSCLFIATKN